MRVCISVCSARDWKPQFGASLCGLIRHVSLKHPEIDLQQACLQGSSNLPKARQMALEYALSEGSDYILMIDDDSKFPPELLPTMLSHKVDIIGINYARKDPSKNSMTAQYESNVVVSSGGKVGKEEVGWVGCGTMLVRLDAIKYLPKPWFETRWLPENKDFLGEDLYFCMKAREHGVKLYVEHSLSNQCSHIGDYPYREWGIL